MKTLLTTWLCIIVVANVAAHPGRTDADGCHQDRKTGVSHCHNDNDPPKNIPAPVQRSEPAQPIRLQIYKNERPQNYQDFDDPRDSPYLQGFDTSPSTVVIVYMPPPNEFISDASELDAHLSVRPKKHATAHITDPSRQLIYEWKTEKGTRILSSNQPNWLANPYHPARNTPHTKTYGKLSVLVDDNRDESSIAFQENLAKQNRIYQRTMSEIIARRDQLQAKINRGVIEEGMTEFEVIAIWGEPAEQGRVGNLVTYSYDNGWTILFENGRVMERDFAAPVVVVGSDKED